MSSSKEKRQPKYTHLNFNNILINNVENTLEIQ